MEAEGERSRAEGCALKGAPLAGGRCLDCRREVGFVGVAVLGLNVEPDLAVPVVAHAHELRIAPVVAVDGGAARREAWSRSSSSRGSERASPEPMWMETTGASSTRMALVGGWIPSCSMLCS